MTELSVGELLRESDRQVRSLTFDWTRRDPKQLASGWNLYRRRTTTALRALERLPGVGQGGLGPAMTTFVRSLKHNPHLSSVGGHLDGPQDETFMEAATLLSEATDLIERRGHLFAGPDAHDVARHVVANFAIATLATRQACAAHLTAGPVDEPLPGDFRLSRGVARSMTDALRDYEGHAVFALHRQNAPLEHLPGTERDLRHELSAWSTAAQAALEQQHPTVRTLREVASGVVVLHQHAQALLAAGRSVEALAPDQAGAAQTALNGPTAAWQAALAELKPTFSTRDQAVPTELRTATGAVRIRLESLTRTDGRWLPAEQVAGRVDTGRAIAHLADTYRDLPSVTRQFQDALGRLADADLIGAPGAAVAALERSHGVQRDPDRMRRAHGRQFSREWEPITGSRRLFPDALGRNIRTKTTTAAVSVTSASITSRYSQAARAAEPTSMSSRSLDQRIRQRVRAEQRHYLDRPRQTGPSTGPAL
ncbi:hypothetical protein PZ938_00240 [Luteipulveratus sp. YIM 133132]|uniref:hypothetical protein n=1 Tax=Luteipulveratus flavus TaxID=3031728 RepID=UPI0023B19393|nr:hypothetical protein [Luteipulveratus sp. YIM 133132]MDE9364023.1 hypothetical protein [Luteipulveratus sp. YIM 133132]